MKPGGRFPPPTLEGLPLPRRNRVPKRSPRPGVDEYGRTPLWNAIARGDREAVRQLLVGHADPNLGDDDGWTPLHIATQRGRVEITELLLQHGADPNRLDHHGNGPLWYAGNEATRVVATERERKVFALLLEAGADPDFKNRYGLSVRDCAVREGWEDLLNRQKPQPSHNPPMHRTGPAV